MPDQPPAPSPSADLPPTAVRKMTRRSFAVWAAAGTAAGGGWWWLRSRTPDGGIPWPLRRVLEFNDRLGQGLFSPTHTAPEFPPSAVTFLKVNGHYGEPDAAPAGRVEGGGRMARQGGRVGHPGRPAQRAAADGIDD